MTAPRASVIVPLRDAGLYVDGLLKQLTPLISTENELIIIDDGSTDGSAIVLDTFAARHPSVKLLRNPAPQGVARSRNRALSEATGRYVWFVDGDDRWDPSALAKLLAATDDSVDIIVCRAELRYADQTSGRVIDGLAVASILTQHQVWESVMAGELHGYLWNKLFRREVLGMDPFEDLTSQSDFTGVMRAFANSATIRTIPDILYFHLVRQGSITRRRDPDLSNLQRAFDVFTTVYASSKSPADRAAYEFFRCWFLAMPYAHTPTRVGAPWGTRIDGVVRARRVLRGTRWRNIFQRSRSLFLRAGLVASLGRVYLIPLSAAQSVRWSMRKSRTS